MLPCYIAVTTQWISACTWWTNVLKMSCSQHAVKYPCSHPFTGNMTNSAWGSFHNYFSAIFQLSCHMCESGYPCDFHHRLMKQHFWSALHVLVRYTKTLQFFFFNKLKEMRDWRTHTMNCWLVFLFFIYLFIWRAWCNTMLSDFLSDFFFLLRSRWIFACGLQFSQTTSPWFFFRSFPFRFREKRSQKIESAPFIIQRKQKTLEVLCFVKQRVKLSKRQV